MANVKNVIKNETDAKTDVGEKLTIPLIVVIIGMPLNFIRTKK